MVKYNTRTKTWSEWGNLVRKRHDHGCTLVDDKVIVAGGYTWGRYLRSTEVVSVETGISRLVGDMHEGRFGVALVTVGGQRQRVLAIGGSNIENGNITSFSSVEIFGTEDETWSFAPFSMRQARFGMANLVITDNICN